ncbi:biotin transporter BioY [Terrihabitans sp. B22-R8]|uniref:biotin transporter BioY n=1 Tax=Terrihabitans sp. B22-R8 TaxID=3425128 RepID=UPI00403CAB59
MDIRGLGRILFFAALIAALGLVPKIDLPLLGGVPITAQSLGVTIAGAFLGARRGALAVILFLVGVAFGLPLLAGGRGGVDVFTGPTAGYLIGFVPAAFVTGWMVERWGDRFGLLLGGTLAAFVGGYVVLNLIGIPFNAWMTGKSLNACVDLAMGLLPGGIVKALLTGVAAYLFEESVGADKGGQNMSLDTRDIVRVSLFAAIIGALGLLPRFDLPIVGGVPVTAQSLGVMLAGVILGARQGALAVMLFLFVVALGAPLLSGGRGGLGVFFGPTAGYLFGYVAAAFVCGLVMERMSRTPTMIAGIIASVIGGILVLYAFGIPWMAWKANMNLMSAIAASTVFLPGDLLKAVATGLIADAASRSAPQTSARRG